MYTLYGAKGSGSAAIEVALERCGIEYQLVRAATWEPDSNLAALKRVNPLQQIPTLVLPDATVVSESAAILIYLGQTNTNAGLLPKNNSDLARVLRGLVFIPANCYAAVSISDYPERWTTDENEVAAKHVRAAARAQLHRHWEIFADTFPASPYLNGATPGALDYLAAVVSKWSGTRAHLKAHRPAFLETLLRIESHPQVASVFARHWDS
jgi:GST-like protein